MVVKALPVPPCLGGQLMACFMSSQRRASLLGHSFLHTPVHVHAPSQKRDGWTGRSQTPIYLSPSAGITRAAKKSLKSPILLLGGLGGPL
ncbi:hypothetical protein CgunFtcFv8_020355 [Champsocephalus gunnari]|uniref:Uncharacterized protein n=1 Tax=Champsocephalus gunnari TaxID=52237 RepID=A0AAN8EE90_CHAGU|nr:hypothetical protein CgunFtcFv8_020355 [Champsocephalus gunnari]